MTEEDNSYNSRVYDTDGSDITFYSATSSPDSTWDSFTTTKAIQSNLTTQSTAAPPLTPDSSFDWFETFFDPASAVCNLDLVFEGMDQTLVDNESTFTKADINDSKRTQIEGHFEYPLSTSVDPLDFNFVPGNSDSSMKDSARPEIFDARISPISWNWSGSSVDDSDHNRFEDLSFHSNDSDNPMNRHRDFDTSPFSQEYAIPTTRDTLETESEGGLSSVLPSKPMIPVYESALNCGDSSVVMCVSGTNQLGLEDNDLTPSVSPDVTWVAKSKYELGDNQSMKALTTKDFGQTESSLIWKPTCALFDHELPDIFLDETADSATEQGSRIPKENQESATREDGILNEKDNNCMKISTSMRKESKDELENSILFDSHEFLSEETDIIKSSGVKNNLLENNAFFDEENPISRCMKPVSSDLSNDHLLSTSSLKLKKQVSKMNPADSKYAQIEQVKETGYMPDYSFKSVPHCQDSLDIGSPDLTYELSSDKTTDHNVLSDYPFSLIGVENSSQDILKTSSIISASDQTAEKISSTCASSNCTHASVRKTERFDHLNSVICDSLIDKGTYDKTNYFDQQLSKKNASVQHTAEATCAEVRYFDDFKQHDFVAITDTIANTSDKHDNNPDYRFKNHTLLNSKHPHFTIPETKFLWMNNTTTTITTTATTITTTNTTTTPFINKTHSTIFSMSCADVSHNPPSPSMESTSGKWDRSNYPFVDDKSQKRKPRRNSDPSILTANICNFRSAQSQEPYVVSFMDIATGKIPGPSNGKNYHPVLPSGLEKKKSLKNSISAPNLLFLLPKEAWNFSKISKTIIDSSATGDVSDHLVSSQQKERTNEIKSNGFQDNIVSVENRNHNPLEQTPSMVDSLSSALCKTLSDILEAPLVSQTVKSVTFPDTNSCLEKLELTKPIKMKVIGCPKSGKEAWSELISGDFSQSVSSISQVDSISTEMFTVSEIDRNCNKIKSTNKNDAIIQIRRSYSLPSTLNQLKSMDLSAGVQFNNRTKDHFLVVPSRLNASSKTFNETDNSKKEIFSINLDIGKKLLMTSSDTSLLSKKQLSPIKGSLESSASGKYNSPLTKKLPNDLNQVCSPSLISHATSTISSNWKSLQNVKPEIPALDDLQRNNRSKEQSANSLFTEKIQLHPKSDESEAVKHSEMRVTKDTLKEIDSLVGSRDSFKTNLSPMEGSSFKFKFRETEYPNNYSVLGDVNYETWRHLPNISNLDHDCQVFKNSSFSQIKKLSENNVSGLINRKITVDHPEQHFDSSLTKVSLKDNFTGETDKVVNDINQQQLASKSVEETLSRVSFGLTQEKDGEFKEKPIPSKLIFDSASNERHELINKEVDSWNVNRECLNCLTTEELGISEEVESECSVSVDLNKKIGSLLATNQTEFEPNKKRQSEALQENCNKNKSLNDFFVKKKSKSFPFLNISHSKNRLEQIDVHRLHEDDSSESSDDVLVMQTATHLERGGESLYEQSSNYRNSHEEIITTQIQPRSIHDFRRMYKSEPAFPVRWMNNPNSEFRAFGSDLGSQKFKLENTQLIDECQEKKPLGTDSSLNLDLKRVKGGSYSKLLSEGPLVPRIPTELTLDDEDDDFDILDNIRPKAMCSYMPFDTDSEGDILEISSQMMENEQRANENSLLSCCCCCLFRLNRNRLTHTQNDDML